MTDACSCDVLSPDVFLEQWRTARKVHECSECGSPIDPGEKYLSITGLWDGTWNHYKHCELCARVWDQAGIEYGDCMAYGQMWDYLGTWEGKDIRKP